MGLKLVVVLSLLLLVSLTVLADTSNDDTRFDASNEATDKVVPQKRGRRGGCKYGCCGSYAYGQCSACCSESKVAEVASEETTTVEPMQRGRGRCRYGCCGSYAYGQCSYCCPRKQGSGAEKEKEEGKP